jgi:protein-S-isoprenylcysteine O-methyltransferase Ste14
MILNRISALVLLVVFYGIYFSKMLIQRRQGIQTNQVGVGEKSAAVRRVERTMSVATLSVVAAEVVSIYLGTGSGRPAALAVGLTLGIAGDLLFAAAVCTMRSSWRAGIPAEDKTELVTDGLYRFSRNPAFFGFDLVYLGVLILCFNPVLLAFSLFAIVMLHLQILQEERFLTQTFGAPYRAYCAQVRRYLGRK